MSERLFDIEMTGAASLHKYDELVKIFLQPKEYVIHRPGEVTVHEKKRGGTADPVAFTDIYYLKYDVTEDEKTPKDRDRYAVSRRIYENLAEYTGKRPKWGVLTGIRPVKLAGELLDEIEGDDRDGDHVSGREKLESLLRHRYLAHDEKIGLVTEILDYQRRLVGRAGENMFSMYVGIPFCPTRCAYCSFTSNSASDHEMERYVDALMKEMEFCAKATDELGMIPESIYVGGGTPTALSGRLLDRMLRGIREGFDRDRKAEFTVEAGRPDTITDEKLHVLRENGIGKISINPQSMKQETLDLIGRKHSVDDIYRAFEMARAAGIGSINMDLIAGLPGEDMEDFRYSLEEVIKLAPEKITLHTLAVKRASRLKDEDENFSYRDEELREEMLAFGAERLRREGYRPYYLYRQKYTSGNTENTGWCRNDDAGVYNIRIMDEHQPILALGAGGISKAYYPEENRLERVPNVSNYELYIDRIDEMIERKKKDFFENRRR